MALIASFPYGLSVPRDVGIFNQELKALWYQERALLNNPLSNFREYSFTGAGVPMTITKNLVLETLNVPVSVPNLDNEIIANSGGLVLPTDRFMSAYDINPNILAVIEWPAGSGYLFTIKTKEYNPASGRCEMQIRQDNHLKGVIYKRVREQKFGGADWSVNELSEEIVVTVNRNTLTYEEQLNFSGIAAIGDVIFWALTANFVLADGTRFNPSIRDMVIDRDQYGNEEVYRIVGTLLDSKENFTRLLCRRFEEN